MEKPQHIADITVMYVEDEEFIRRTLEKPLSRRIKSLILAADGAEGLELFQKHHPDIIITDINMPNMDGFEMIEKVRAINPDVPVIITTALNEEKHLARMQELGIDKYIIKPIDVRELLKTMQHILQNGHSPVGDEGEEDVLVIGPRTNQQHVLPSLYQYLKKNSHLPPNITNKEIFSDRALLENIITVVKKLHQQGKIMFLNSDEIPVLDLTSPIAPCNKSFSEMENYLRAQVKQAEEARKKQEEAAAEDSQSSEADEE
ncbi:response regulator [Desulfurispira natronophila]|uniref:CheY-like chemotaxis protein n=1 Tax=Desulfurispira natronophila TaxID=682562 RepID=A0A7W7Y4Q9_9BACT|nr:response regulator [Desulfurispira natronophila]MBB5022056.1 CheY-like chemotaxis protein [Desulfurispira natronophila]